MKTKTKLKIAKYRLHERLSELNRNLNSQFEGDYSFGWASFVEKEPKSKEVFAFLNGQKDMLEFSISLLETLLEEEYGEEWHYSALSDWYNKFLDEAFEEDN
tara:strand:- start:546 stop:851 length:306 start_codon:yes stop_codon:yes gene_type:complete